MAGKKTVQPNIRENRYKKVRARSAPKGSNWLWTLFRVLAGAVAIIVMSLVFVFGYDWATQSDYFRAETVEVHGIRRLSEQRVKQAAGIENGVNIFSVNLSTARRRLMALDWVAGAEVRRQVPESIIIRIREHEPVARIDLGKTFMINPKGEIFREAAKGAFSDLPIIKGLNYADWQRLEVGRAPVVSSVMAVLGLDRKGHSVFNTRSIEQIQADRDLGLVLQIRDLPIKQVRLGYGNYGQKLRRLEKVLVYLENKEPSVEFEKMDLRNPDRIVARPAADKQSQTIGQKEEA